MQGACKIYRTCAPNEVLQWKQTRIYRVTAVVYVSMVELVE